MHDNRFKTLEEKDREEMFQDYLDDLEKQEREDQRTNNKRQIQNIKSLFEERHLSLETTWEECQEKFKDNPIFKSADNFEKIR